MCAQTAICFFRETEELGSYADTQIMFEQDLIRSVGLL
jgi:hypothetical protein